MAVSPASFSRSTSRRSSIGHEDHLLPPAVDSKILNRDPFQDIGTTGASTESSPLPPYLPAKKYSSHSLPRNFSLQKVSEKQQPLTPFIEDSECKKTTLMSPSSELPSTERCKSDYSKESKGIDCNMISNSIRDGRRRQG